MFNALIKNTLSVNPGVTLDQETVVGSLTVNPYFGCDPVKNSLSVRPGASLTVWPGQAPVKDSLTINPGQAPVKDSLTVNPYFGCELEQEAVTGSLTVIPGNSLTVTPGATLVVRPRQMKRAA